MKRARPETSEEHSGLAVNEKQKEIIAKVVKAYIANNALPAPQLPELIGMIANVFNTINDGSPVRRAAAHVKKQEPAVPIRSSVTRHFIICLEDGRRMRSMKQHLKNAYNMTPDDYRRKWGLSEDYPMVAPSYAELRSEIAKRNHLGRKKASLRPNSKK